MTLHAQENAKGWLASIEEMLAALTEASTNNTAYEAAEQAIHESILSVLVRDGWHEPGKSCEDGPDEYEILLTTGGPALRIWGKINDHGEPGTAELQYQDWGTLWTRYPAREVTLLSFAQCFWFGE
jgi:hypothetical protein